jgi:8-oxo-dGTP pyrophosphatase MutT (NUDIX family)
MPEEAEANVPVPKLSSTILLVRDGASDMEVFMVQRHHQIDFARGAMVFPGGKVEPADELPAMRDHCHGIEDLDDAQVAVRVAAIRETFEECGVLLARPRGSDSLVDTGRLAQIEETRRAPLRDGELDARELVEREELVLACDLLVHFAHWITPTILPKRFNTHFFLVTAPPDQLALHDGQESIDSVWITPAEAVAEAEAGRRTIIFPTLLNLKKLGRSHSVAEATLAARRDTIVTVLPRAGKGENGEPILHIPEEAGYGASFAPMGKPP